MIVENIFSNKLYLYLLSILNLYNIVCYLVWVSGYLILINVIISDWV